MSRDFPRHRRRRVPRTGVVLIRGRSERKQTRIESLYPTILPIVRLVADRRGAASSFAQTAVGSLTRFGVNAEQSG